MCNFFKNPELPGAFILVSSFGGKLVLPEDEITEKLENDIKENLELFESTKYYRDKTEFEYEEDIKDEITGDRLVNGILKNHRTEEDMFFYGYYIQSPVAYVFGIFEREEHREKIKSVIDGAVAAAYVEESTGE